MLVSVCGYHAFVILYLLNQCLVRDAVWNILLLFSSLFIVGAVLFSVRLDALLEHVYADADHGRRADSYTGSGLSSRHGKTRFATRQTVSGVVCCSSETDDEVFMTRSLIVTLKTTEQNLIVRSGKSEAAITNNKRLRSMYWTAKAN